MKRVHSLLNTGHSEVAGCDLSNCFGEIPHAELMKCIARRVSDGRMPGLIKAWLEMPVEEDDGEGRQTPREPGAQGAERDPAGGSGLAPNAKGNFRFEREILQWRDRPLIDLRRKR